MMKQENNEKLQEWMGVSEQSGTKPGQKRERERRIQRAQTRLIYVHHKVVYRLINTVELNVLSLLLTLAIY